MRKLADVMLLDNHKPAAPTEPLDQLKRIIETRADKQFTLDRMFSANATTREKERAKAQKLFVQGRVATTDRPILAKTLHEDHSHEVHAGPMVDKVGMAVLTDEEMEILGMEKKAGKASLHPQFVSRLLQDVSDYTGTPVRVLKRRATQATKRAVKQAKKKEKRGSVAPTVDAWFQKHASQFLTQAQRRNPEMLKAAALMRRNKTTPTSAPGPGPVAVRSSLSGGAA
jgi:hypothetical protein